MLARYRLEAPEPHVHETPGAHETPIPSSFPPASGAGPEPEPAE
jgi:hypothetical protein